MVLHASLWNFCSANQWSIQDVSSWGVLVTVSTAGQLLCYQNLPFLHEEWSVILNMPLHLWGAAGSSLLPGTVPMAVCAQREGGSLAGTQHFGLPVQNTKAGVCVCSWNELAQTAEKVNAAECPWGSGAPCSDKTCPGCTTWCAGISSSSPSDTGLGWEGGSGLKMLLIHVTICVK